MPRVCQRSKPHYPFSFAWCWISYCSRVLHWYLPQGNTLWTLNIHWAMQNPNPKAQSRWYQLGAMGHGSIPLDIILGNWLQLALLEQEGWTWWPADIPADLSYSVIMWLCGVPWTNGVKHHWDLQHFLLHWKGHTWEGVLGVCGDVSRIPIQSPGTDRAIGGFWFSVLQAVQAAARACCPILH